MRHSWFAGIAAIALLSGPAIAQGKGNGGGNGHGNDKGAMQAANPGKGSGGGSGGGDGAKGNGRGNGGSNGGAMMQASAPSPGNGNGRSKADNRDGGQPAKIERVSDRPEKAEIRNEGKMAKGRDDRGNGAMKPERVADDRPGNGGKSMAKPKDDNPGRSSNWKTWQVRPDGDGARLRQVFATPQRGLIDGCPPGLAAKNNGCRPPGLARQQDSGWQNTLYRPDWWGYSNYAEGRYVYDNGYLYRLGAGDNIASYIPLLGGALGIGNGWPSYYEPVALPDYYQRYYGLGPLDTYRYADDVIYRVDPTTSAITSIAALLTGDTFNVGSRLPLGYDAYNVPYPYRDQYFDTPDNLYRYSDGYVYEVDPKTQLITAAIQLLGNVL